MTVQPKHPVAAVTPSQPESSPSSTASPTPTPVPTTTAKDVDHAVCVAVRADLLTAQQKVGGADKSDPRKMGADFKAAGTALKSQAQKTKVAELKTTLVQLAADYTALGANVAAKRPTDADLKKIADIGPKLDELCPQKT